MVGDVQYHDNLQGKAIVLRVEPAPLPLCLAQIASVANPGHNVEEAAINGLTSGIALGIDNTEQSVHFPQIVLYSCLKLLYEIWTSILFEVNSY